MNIEYISKNWNPRFVIKENQMVSFLIYEGDNDSELRREKQRLLSEVGFKLEDWYYQELCVENVSKMTSELAKKISDYEASGRCVKQMFLNMLLTSEWEQPFIRL